MRSQVFEYILPLYEIRIVDYNTTIENAYLEASNKYKYKVLIIFSEEVKNNEYLKHEDYCSSYLSDGKYIVEMFLPTIYAKDVYKIIDSRYSEISDTTKQSIIKYSLYRFSWNQYTDGDGNIITSEQYGVIARQGKKCRAETKKREELHGLYADDSLREKLAKQLDVDINLISKEVIGKFKEDNFYKVKNKSITWRTDINTIDGRIKEIEEELLLLKQRKDELLTESVDI